MQHELYDPSIIKSAITKASNPLPSLLRDDQTTRSSLPGHLKLLFNSPKSAANTMAHIFARLFSSRACRPLSPFSSSSPIPRICRAAKGSNFIARRTYATGESGPNPKPGQSPFKIWPFLLITAAGSGAYILMVQQRAGEFNWAYFTFLEMLERAGSILQELREPL